MRSGPPRISRSGPSMSPKGVEHVRMRTDVPLDIDVHPSMSPKGVEHWWDLYTVART